MIRVIATDGLLSGSDISDAPFSLEGHAPRVSIDSPEHNAEFGLEEIVSLTGSAYDLEDGYMTGASLEWSVEGLGVIGSNDTVALPDLPEGAYAITLSVTDKDGNTSRDVIIIHIKQFPNAQLLFLPLV